LVKAGLLRHHEHVGPAGIHVAAELHTINRDHLDAERSRMHGRGNAASRRRQAIVSPVGSAACPSSTEHVRPNVVQFRDTTLSNQVRWLRVEEVMIPPGSGLIGARLRDSAIRNET
jgi:hypothetical protein